MKAILKTPVLVLILAVIGLDAFSQPVSQKPRNSAYDQKLEDERKIIPYDHLREADVFWERRIWRIIDAREKINLPFVYPKEPLISILTNAIEKEGLVAYSAIDDEFNSPITVQEIMSGLNKVDSFWTVDPVTQRDTLIITETKFNPLEVQKFRVQEVWIFDEETSTMIVRILGLAPVRDVLDQATGEIRGESDMFWIYYPDARQIMANKYAFNPHNDAIRMSWEDIFEMRLFGSYIVKESNVYDRMIAGYKTGIDAVLESEKIKLDIFKKEHELWEF